MAIPTIQTDTKPTAQEIWATIPDDKEITAARVVADPTCLYKAVRKIEGKSVLNGLPYDTYAVAPSIRDRLITYDLRTALNIRHQRSFSHIQLPKVDDDTTQALEQVIDKDIIQALKNVVDEEAGTPLFKDMDILALCSDNDLVSRIGTTPKKITVPEASQYKEGTLLTLYNNTEGHPIHVHYEGHKPSLRAGCAMVLKVVKNDSVDNVWSESAKYETKLKTDHTNPLLIDHMRAKQNSCRGEYFIPPQMIKKQIEAACQDEAASPATCEYDTRMTDAFCQLFTKKGNRAQNLLISSTSSEHAVAVRVIPRKDENTGEKKIFIYIHETLKPGDKVVQVVEERILKTALSAYRGHSIYVVKPDFQMQMDSSCCSLFALQAFLVFEQDSELDEKIIELAEARENEKTSKTVCINGHAGLPGTTRRSHKQKEKNIGYLEDESHYLSVTEMPAKLLMCNQNKGLFEGKDGEKNKGKLDESVDTSGTTLREHFERHEYEVECLVGTKSTSRVNLYATGLRYQSLLREQALKEKTSEPVIPEQEVAEEMTQEKPSTETIDLERINEEQQVVDESNLEEEAYTNEEQTSDNVIHEEEASATQMQPVDAETDKEVPTETNQRSDTRLAQIFTEHSYTSTAPCFPKETRAAKRILSDEAEITTTSADKNTPPPSKRQHLSSDQAGIESPELPQSQSVEDDNTNAMNKAIKDLYQALGISENDVPPAEAISKAAERIRENSFVISELNTFLQRLISRNAIGELTGNQTNKPDS